MNTTITTAAVRDARAPTAMQWAVMGFLFAFHRQEDRLPTRMEICAHFGWRSANAADSHINVLIAKGLIEKRGIHLRFARTAAGMAALERLLTKEQGEQSPTTPADLEPA